MLQIDPQSLDVNATYSLMTRAIVPRPIAWVSSCSAEGQANLAPFSYFNGVGSLPPTIVFSCVNWPDGREKDTARNIRETREFVVHVVPFRMAEAMVTTSQPFPPDVDEFDEAGLEKIPSVKVRPPRIAAAPIHLECRLHDLITVGQGSLAANVIIGEIVLFHVDSLILDESGMVDAEQLDAVGRLGGKLYSTTRDQFTTTASR